LQILDEGRLTDNRGITIDFTNTIIILTSNILAGEDDSDLYKRELYQYFKPEFINRLDAIVKFNTLSYEDLMEITKIYLEEVKNDFDELNHHKEDKETNNDEKVDTSDYKRVNTEGDKTHHNHKNNSKVDIKNSKNKASEDKPFYSNWWFWVLLVIILWAIWYFGFRNPNTI
ncbi:MAG: AAA family ATPase, partial [Anaerococcus sp.]|nr:AAA family ATPase [Anaerococcus sp.]